MVHSQLTDDHTQFGFRATKEDHHFELVSRSILSIAICTDVARPSICLICGTHQSSFHRQSPDDVPLDVGIFSREGLAILGSFL